MSIKWDEMRGVKLAAMCTWFKANIGSMIAFLAVSAIQLNFQDNDGERGGGDLREESADPGS